MYGKAILTVTFITVLVLTYSILIGTVDLKSYFFLPLQQQQQQQQQQQSCGTPPATTTQQQQQQQQQPLKVYMYDLPRRFNFAMMDPNYRSEKGAGGGVEELPPVTRMEDLPKWRLYTGVGRQHSVEYWMMASLLYYNGGGGEVVRVLDPEIAEAFFVPFFSSLSFNSHGHVMTDPETEIDHQLQADLLDFLRKSKYWQRSAGRDHVIPMTHPNAFRFLRQEINASILIVADFGRYPRSMATLRKDVVAPYVHIVNSYTDDNVTDPFESRTTLLFFRGNTVRKDEGKVRAKLAKILSGIGDVVYEKSSPTNDAIRASTQGMRSSKFCLHPAGDTPSSCRLFDAIVSHCVPVIVSDKVELPFEDEIDYTQFSIFFSVKEAIQPGYMIDQLRQFPKERWIEMWQRLKDISHHFEFQFPPQKEDAVNMIWREIKHKVPSVRLAVHRSRRLKVPDWWGGRR